MTEEKVLRVVWAVDPFGEVKEFQMAAASMLERLGERLPIEVIPIYLYGGYPLEFSLYAPPAITDQERTQLHQRMGEILDGRKFRQIRELEILVKPYVTLRDGVGRLQERVSDLGVDLIVATTHARKGVTRWIIGSFAEALSEQFTIPVLIFNPENESAQIPESIVFTTDFSEGSQEVFRELMPLARAMKVSLEIFHKVTQILTPTLAELLASSSIGRERLELKLRDRRKRGEEWAKSAKLAGVDTDVCIDSNLAGSPAEAALFEAKMKKAWLAVASHGSTPASKPLGRTARRIIQNAEVPVLILRPRISGDCRAT